MRFVHGYLNPKWFSDDYICVVTWQKWLKKCVYKKYNALVMTKLI